LPPGPLLPPPPADPLPRLTLPAFVASGTGGVAVTVVGERGMGLTAALGIAADRLHERLRLERGLSYASGGTYDVLCASHAHASLGADCLDEHAGEVAETLLAVLDDLRENGPAENELDEYADRAERADREDPDRPKDLLDRAVTDALLDAEITGAEELREQRRAVRPADAARALDDALPGALLIAPDGTPKPRPELAGYDASETRSFDGRTFKAKGLVGSAKLTVGADGLTHVGGPDGTVSLPREECVFAVRNQSGSLTVVGRDATYLEVDPRHWRDGDALLEAIEGLLPGDLFVPGEDQAAGEVQRLAAEQLTRRWLVDEELEVLPEQLQPGERLRSLGRASRGMKHGLLALTDRRLLFLHKGMRKDDLLEIPIEGVTDARGRRGLTEGKLTVSHSGEKTTFGSVVPRERAPELAQALEAGAG
ncbi:MAG: PH domain-containing protein, partial [Actinomycetota bacterium]|nr:PH domain-containing protein [Actinomycetota bacterium]